MDKLNTLKTSLCGLAIQYRSDKTPSILHSYTPAYDSILKTRKDSVSFVLEVGIGNLQLMNPIVGSDYKPGASLRMWRDYFPNATIIGVDIRKEVLFHEDRIITFQGDQSETVSLLNLLGQMNQYFNKRVVFDIIIDDGSHILEHQITTLWTYFPLLNPKGIYIVEDIRRSDLNVFKNIGSYLPNCENIYVHEGEFTQDDFVAYFHA